MILDLHYYQEQFFLELVDDQVRYAVAIFNTEKGFMNPAFQSSKFDARYLSCDRNITSACFKTLEEAILFYLFATADK